MEVERAEMVEFLKSLEGEPLSEKNALKRVALLRKMGGGDDDSYVAGNDDDTGGYAKINGTILRRHVERDLNQPRCAYINEQKCEDDEEEEDESDDDDDDDVDGGSVGSSSVESHKIPSVQKEKKRHSLWAREGGKNTDVSNRVFEGILYKKKKLNFKKYWAVLLGQRLLLSRHGYDNNNNKRKTNCLKVNKDIDLDDYEVSITSQNSGKVELKLVRPGRKTFLLYCKEEAEANKWEKEIKKASKLEYAMEDMIDLESVNEENSVYIRGDIYDVINNNKQQHSLNHSQLSNNNNLHNNKDNSNHNSTDNYGVVFRPSEMLTTSFDVSSDSSARVTTHQHQQQQQHKGKKSKMQSLLDMMKGMRSNKMAADDDVIISGLLSVDCGQQWCQRFCDVREGSFQAYKQNESTDDTTVVSLAGCHVTLMPCSDWLMVLLRQEDKEVQIKFKNHSELTKWYQILVDQSGKRYSQMSPVSSSVPEVLYDEIREGYNHDFMKTSKRPALPDCPAPITPDVNQVLMNINECSYMDAIECRGVVRSFGMKEKSNRNPSYSNSDEFTKKDIKDKVESIYNNMDGCAKTTSTTTTSPTSTSTTTTSPTSTSITSTSTTSTSTTTSLNNSSNTSRITDTEKHPEKLPNINTQSNARSNTQSNTLIETYRQSNTQEKQHSITERDTYTDSQRDTHTHTDKQRDLHKQHERNSHHDNDAPFKSHSNDLTDDIGNNNINNSNNNNNSNKNDNINSKINNNKYSNRRSVVKKFSACVIATTTPTTTTTSPTTTSIINSPTTITSSRTAISKKVPSTTMENATTFKLTQATSSPFQKGPPRLSNSQTSLLRLQYNGNNNNNRNNISRNNSNNINNNNNTHSCSYNKRYSDNIKGSLILEKIKMFESRNN